MSVSAFSIFFYRPFKKASDFCTDRLATPLLKRMQPAAQQILNCAQSYMERAKPYANSLLGRIAKSAVCETVGSLVGAAVGEVVISSVSKAIGPQIVPTVCAIGLVGAVITKKKPQMALFSAGFVIPAFISRAKQAECFSLFGQYVGRTAGTIIGGYFGLTKLAKAKIDLLNRTKPSDSYSVNMLKFQIVGELFDGVIVQSSIPFAGAILNLPRNTAKAIFQALAYNSQMSVPLFRKCLREKRLTITIPVAIKIITSRYCVEHSESIAMKTTQMLSKTVLPRVLQSLGGAVGGNLIESPLRKSLDYLGERSDQFATIVMRGFHQFSQIVKDIHSGSKVYEIEHDDMIEIELETETKENQGKPVALHQVSLGNLKASFKKRIPGSKAISPVFDLAMKAHIAEWTHLMTEMIGDTERELVGVNILGKEQQAHIEEVFPIYLKYYLIYILLNAPKLNHEFTLIEERAFFSDLNGAFFSIYTSSSNPNQMVVAIHKVASCGIDGFYAMRRYFEPTDEETLVAAPIVLEENHIAPTPAAESRIDGGIQVSDDYFAN